MAALRVFEDSQLDRRLAWPDRIHFIFACVGNSMGYGVLWRFPSLACLHGGGGFLYPYVILLFILGLPICYVEMAIGQFCNRGPVTAFACLAPICTGIGISMALVSLLVTFYYNTFTAFNFFYIHKSIISWHLPWLECNSLWGADEYCVVPAQLTNESLPLCSDLKDHLSKNGTQVNDSQLHEFVNCTNKSLQTSTEQYFHKVVLGSSDIDVSDINWLLAFYLLISWLITFLSIFVGCQFTKKVFYLTFIIPFIMLLCLLLTSLDRDGGIDGILFFLLPQWKYFIDLKVWISSACQVFYSLNVAYGGIIMYSSFKNINDKIFQDAIVVVFINLIISLISGCVVFSTIGFLSRKLNASINQVSQVVSGPALIYVVYPEALAGYPLPHLWHFVFFLMLVLLGLYTPFTLIQTFLTSIFEFFHRFIKYGIYASISVCVICFVFNIACITQIGSWMINALDRACSGLSILFIALCEICGISLFYGARRFCNDILFMTGTKPSRIFSIYWSFFLPLLLTVFLIYYLFDPPPIVYFDSTKPSWVNVIVWILTFIVIIQIPAWAIAAVIYRKVAGKPVKTAFSNNSKWAPAEAVEHDAYHHFTSASKDEVASGSTSSATRAPSTAQTKHKLTPFPSFDTGYFLKTGPFKHEDRSKGVKPDKHENPDVRPHYSAHADLSSGASAPDDFGMSLQTRSAGSPSIELSPIRLVSRSSINAEIATDVSPEEEKSLPTEKTELTSLNHPP